MARAYDNETPSADSEPVRPVFEARKTVDVKGLGGDTHTPSSQLPYQQRAADRTVLDRNFVASDQNLTNLVSENGRQSEIAEPAQAPPSNALGSMLSGAIKFAGKALDSVAGFFENLVAPTREASPSTDRGSEPQNAPSNEKERDAAVHAEMQAIVQKSDASRDAAMEKQFPDHSIYNGPDRQNKGRGR